MNTVCLLSGAKNKDVTKRCRLMSSSGNPGGVGRNVSAPTSSLHSHTEQNVGVSKKKKEKSLQDNFPNPSQPA